MFHFKASLTYDPTKPEAVAKMRSCVAVRDDDWWLAIDYAGVELGWSQT